MSTVGVDLPQNVNPDTPVSEDIGGTGISNPLGNYIKVTGGPVAFTVPSGGSTVTLPSSGTIPSSDTSDPIVSTIEVNYDAPGGVVAVTGNISNISPTMESGSLTGLRGHVTVPAATEMSAGFLYGTIGKLTIDGEMSGTSSGHGVFGQLDLTNSTLTGANVSVACVRGDAGLGGPVATLAAVNIFRSTNETPSTVNSHFSAFGKATFFIDADQDGSAFFVDSGTSAGSAGDTTKCNAPKVLAIQVDGVSYFVPAFDQNT